MQERTRQRLLLFIGILLAVLLGLWWYSGFSLDFMRFFAAEPGAPVVAPAAQQEETPCEPRPACLDASPACQMAQPAGGWCKPAVITLQCGPTKQIVKVGQTVTLTGSGGSGIYTWYAPEATLAGAPVNGQKGASITISYAAQGRKKVTVESGRGDGSANVDSVACAVIVQP